jgi:hypothetical protein
MSYKFPVALLAAWATWLLPGCSTPPAALIESVPPPDVSRVLPLEPYTHISPNEPAPPDPAMPVGKICQLGTTCLAMDPRPFEMCLLGARKRCSEKVREPLLVENPEVEQR